MSGRARAVPAGCGTTETEAPTGPAGQSANTHPLTYLTLSFHMANIMLSIR